jgi:hypothetical protein
VPVPCGSFCSEAIRKELVAGSVIELPEAYELPSMTASDPDPDPVPTPTVAEAPALPASAFPSSVPAKLIRKIVLCGVKPDVPMSVLKYAGTYAVPLIATALPASCSPALTSVPPTIVPYDAPETVNPQTHSGTPTEAASR